jgi:glucans biosynthesis protein
MLICSASTHRIRRTVRGLRMLPLAALLVAALQVGPVHAFEFEDVVRQAELAARAPYNSISRPPPAELQALSYDEYRDIRFRPDHALWRSEGLPFELMFFHLGKFQMQPVRINEVTSEGVRRLRYDVSDFDFGNNKLATGKWRDLGFAGFRAHYPLNGQTYKDELIVFLGASYFRALGAGTIYGISARGLAIDTVGGQQEEFPRFSEFWIERPAANARVLTVYALLESPRANGAYQFDIHPGETTTVDVRARIFLRPGVATLGVAPLTSMYFFGENQPHRTDFRPEVHDSDGLMVASGTGEWLWRPLLNPKATLATSFAMPELRGFGLMQRDRNFSSYEDGEARYELRPSVWIEPLGAWGPGRVELVQLNTTDETNDNVVAYWVPSKLPEPGQPLEVKYRLHWQGAKQQRPPDGWVVQTRIGRGYAELAEDEHHFAVDFTGPTLASLQAGAPVKAVVSAPANGEIIESNVYRLEATGAWRMTLRVKQLQPSQTTELRGYLQRGEDVLTETWSNVIPARPSPAAR